MFLTSGGEYNVVSSPEESGKLAVISLSLGVSKIAMKRMFVFSKGDDKVYE